MLNWHWLAALLFLFYSLTGNIHANPAPNCTNPFEAQIQAPVFCYTQTLTVRFSRPVLCSTVDVADFRFLDPQGRIMPIAFVRGVTCNPNDTIIRNASDTLFQLRLFSRLNLDGAYRLIVIADSLRDTCNNLNPEINFSQILANLPIEFTVSETQQVCEGRAGVRLTARTNNNPTAVQYRWFPNVGLDTTIGANVVATPPRTITYTVTAVSGNCAQTSNTVQVIYIPKPRAEVRGDIGICQGRPLRLQAFGAESYRWLPFQLTGDSINVPLTRSRLVEVIPRSRGCEGDTVRLQVVVIDTPSVNFELPTEACQYQPFSIRYRGRDTTAIFTWFFEDGLVTLRRNEREYDLYFPNFGARTLTVIANHRGCISRRSIPIVVRRQPEVDAGPDISICAGTAPLPLRGTMQGTSGCRYAWSPAVGLNDSTLLVPLANPRFSTNYTLTVFCPGCAPASDVMRVNVVEPPVVRVPNKILYHCIGGGGTTLDVELVSGREPLTYRWQPNIALDNANVLRPRANPSNTITYRLTVTDSSGCETTAEITLNAVPLPIVDAGPDQLLCSDSLGVRLLSTILNPVNEGERFTYLWTPAKGLSDPTNSSPYATPDSTTIYALVVRSQLTGCSSLRTRIDTISTVSVVVGRRPIADAGPDTTICFRDEIVIGGIPNGGGPNYQYRWSPSIALSSIQERRPIAAPEYSMTYYLTVLSNGCQSLADSIRITVQPRPPLRIRDNVLEICLGDTAELDVFTVDSAIVRYDWSPGEGLSDSTIKRPKAFPTESGFYKVHVILPNGCSSEFGDSVFVNVLPLPRVEADRNRPRGIRICFGDTARINASVDCDDPFSFFWNPVPDPFNPRSLRPMATPQQTTRYFLTAICGPCRITDSVDIFVTPEIQVEGKADTTIICVGDSVELSAAGGLGAARFRWTPDSWLRFPDSTTTMAFPRETTDYIITARELGCIGTDTVRIIVYPKPEIDFDWLSDTGCVDFAVRFRDRSTDSRYWEWDFGDGNTSNEPNPLHVYESPGQFPVKLKVWYNNICQTDSVAFRNVWVRPRVQANFEILSAETLYFPEPDLILNNLSRDGTRWLWEFGDGNYSTAFSPTYRYSQPGTYTVVLIGADSSDCSDTISKRILVLDPQIIVPNVFSPNADGANDRWEIQYFGDKRFVLVVYDRTGMIVYESNTPADSWNGNLKNSGSPLQEGTYFYVLEIGSLTRSGSVNLLR
jgi:gliding motility-associated-like protein